MMTIVGCSSLRLSNFNYTVTGETDKLSDRSTIQVLVNQDSLLLTLDTGADVSMLKLSKDKKHKRIGKLRITNARGEVFNVDRIFLNKLHLHSIRFNDLIVTNNDNDQVDFSCIEGIVDEGVIGMDLFNRKNEESIIHLNFNDNQFEVLRSENTIPEDYKLIESTFDGSKVSIRLQIQDKPVDLVIDSGSDIFMALESSSKQMFSRSKQIALPESVGVLSGGITKISKKIYKDVPYQLAGRKHSSSLVYTIDNLKLQHVGRPFLRQYNWIIDFQKKRVFSKYITEFDSNKEIRTLTKFKNLAIAIGNKLIVIQSTNPRLLPGSIILKVDNKKVNATNICQLQRTLLDNTDDWSKFDIIIQ